MSLDIVPNTCVECDVTFPHNYRYLRHREGDKCKLKRKGILTPIFTCMKCCKTFNQKINMQKHYDCHCKSDLLYTPEEMIQKLQLENMKLKKIVSSQESRLSSENKQEEKISELESTILELKNKEAHNWGTLIQDDVEFINFGEERLSTIPDFQRNLITENGNCLMKLILHYHKNPNYPEFQNLYFKDGIPYGKCNEGWKRVRVDQMIRKHAEELMSYYKSCGQQIKDTFPPGIMKMLEDCHKNAARPQHSFRQKLAKIFILQDS